MDENWYDHATGRWVVSFEQDRKAYEEAFCAPAFRGLEDALLGDASAAWLLLLRLVAEAPERALALIGAGPLESFVNRHGAAFVDHLEAALSDPRFLEAAQNMDIYPDSLPRDVEDRLVALIGEGARPLREDAEPEGDGIR